MNLKGNIKKSRMQGILGTNPAAIPITVDNALSLSSTNPVQNRVITAAITNRLWSDEVKAALLQIVEKVAYIDEDGQDYYDALYDALYPPVGLDSISAVFDAGGATIYNTDTLDDLEQYLTVTAYYSSGDSEVVTTYTLSGSMDAGTQTITVSYGGKTTTFTVTVVEWTVSISAVFTQGSATIYTTDTLDTLRQYLVVTATYGNSTTAVVTGYTLSGTLEVGTSTITVSYGGKTDTFSVVVTEAVFVFVRGYAVGTFTKNGQSYAGRNENITARASTLVPISNNNFSFTVTDSSKYNVNAIDVLSLDHYTPSGMSADFVDGFMYKKGNKTIAWGETSSVTTSYVWLVLKKMDGTDFTDDELAGEARAVITYTEGS